MAQSYPRDENGWPQPHPDNLNALALATINGGEPLADAFREFAHSQSPVNLANLGAALAEYATVQWGFSPDAILDIVRASEYLNGRADRRID